MVVRGRSPYTFVLHASPLLGCRQCAGGATWVLFSARPTVPPCLLMISRWPSARLALAALWPLAPWLCRPADVSGTWHL